MRRVALAACTLACAAGLAQATAKPRITQAFDDAQRVTLLGNVDPRLRGASDLGPVPDSFPASRVFLLVKRSPESEAALQAYLKAAATRGSASYHQWLTPEEFGRRFGPADADVAAIKGWLKGHGFSVAGAVKGKTAIEFSGNAGQVRAAFHTQIHTYLVAGETHHANASDPEIPAALAGVVAGITPMNDFRSRSNALVLGKARYDLATHQAMPEWTLGSSNYLLAPGDFATQYDLNPLYKAATNGAGVTIGVIGDSNVDPTLVTAFRSVFGLAAGTLNVVLAGDDPGVNNSASESYLDVETAGGVAPGAVIDLYTAAATYVQDGIDLAAMKAVDDDVAPVLSMSYGECEQLLGASGNAFWGGVWEQAAAQGQTVLVSSGDAGSAGCDDFNDIGVAASGGLAVNGEASTPWNIAVGGTDFYYSDWNNGSQVAAQVAGYWNQTATGLPAESLLREIPEQVWNRPFGMNIETSYHASQPVIIAGSGGVSSCTNGVAAADGTYATCVAGYAKPVWQTGTGVPADGVRDVPDVSLFAGAGENESAYPICANPGECVPENGYIEIEAGGGTSASTPAMAGIMAMVVEKYGRQGQANQTIYPLAKQHPEIFHDVTVGGDVVPCVQGSPDCSLSTAQNNTNGIDTLGKYTAAAGYDLASGWGSIDASLLLSNWNDVAFAPTNTTLSVSKTNFAHGTPVTVSVAVTGSGGTPTGQVALESGPGATESAAGVLTLQGGAATSVVDDLPGGKYTLTAQYGGDGSFAASTSPGVALDVTPESSSTGLTGLDVVGNYVTYTATQAPIVNGGTYPYGSSVVLNAQPTGASAPAGGTDGIATGTVTFTDSASAGTVSSGSLTVSGVGIANWIPVSVAAGTHSVVANYSGDASFAPSTSLPLSFTIAKAPTGLTLTASPNPVALGAPTTLTALVGVNGNTAVPPTGTMTFLYGNVVLGTAQLAPCAAGSVCGYQGSGFATAQLSTSGLPLGMDLVTAVYGGDANFQSFTSAQGVTVTVEQNAGLTATASPNPATQVDQVVVTANVAAATGLPQPTGYVFFSTPNYSCGSAPPLANGTTSCSFFAGALGLGTSTMTVQYLGDGTYAPEAVTIPVVVTAPFSLAGTPVTIAAGATSGNTSTLTVTPAGGFTGTLSMGCALTASPAGAIHLPTCSLTPALSVTGTSAATEAMTIESTAATSGKLEMPGTARWLGGASLAGLIWCGVRRRRRFGLMALCLTLPLAMGLSGCTTIGMPVGSGGGGGGLPGTTPGAYTFTVTAVSGQISVTAPVVVTIQ